MKYIQAFGAFWYDFIVGDSIILAIGGVTALVLGYLVVLAGAAALAEVVLPLVVVATIILSLLR
jgi:hypothetical protein